MIRYHLNNKEEKIGEIMSPPVKVSSADDILDYLAEASFNECGKLIIHSESFHPDFFNLRTGIAGDILQKFSNYRMRLAIIGDFSVVKSKSLGDFIRESNKRGIIRFVDSLEEAMK